LARRIGVREDAERTQSLLDEEGDVLRREENAQPRLDRIGERGVVSAAVRRLRDRVEQLRELDDLAVMAPEQIGRILEAGILVAADELDTCGAPRTRLARLVATSASVADSPMRLLRLPPSGDIVFTGLLSHCQT
jgi:hypothetical protein